MRALEYLRDVKMPMQRPQSEFLPKVGAGCLVAIGMFMAVMAVTAMAQPDNAIAGLLVMLLLGAGFGAAGVYWWRFALRSETRGRSEFEDKSVLRVAARHGGIVTVALITLETELSADEAREAIESLCIRGVAYPDVQDDGSIQYRFPGLLGGA